VLALEYKPENAVFAEKNEVSGGKPQKLPRKARVAWLEACEFSLSGGGIGQPLCGSLICMKKTVR
jgi:hypothetical protein